MNIIHNTQSRPTCFMIDRKGTIQIRYEGIDQKRLENFLKSDGYLK
jgi:hypothetical protein